MPLYRYNKVRGMALRVLFIGGTGEISLASVREAVAAGHAVTVFNRGKSRKGELPAGVTSLVGDIHDGASYAKLRASKFDVVCSFMVFKTEEIEPAVRIFSGNVGRSI